MPDAFIAFLFGVMSGMVIGVLIAFTAYFSVRRSSTRSQPK